MIELVVVLALLVLGFTLGTLRERRHLRSLHAREKHYTKVLVTDLRALPPGWKSDEGRLVQGQAVIGSDYFKSFVAALINIFGGRIRTFETLMARARREAKLRMIAKAAAMGANAVWNVRMETSTIGRGGSGGVPMAEVHVYGTAYRIESLPQSDA